VVHTLLIAGALAAELPCEGGDTGAEVGPRFSGTSLPVDEGSEFIVALEWPGCPEPDSLQWSWYDLRGLGEEPILSCEIRVNSLLCEVVDEASLVFEVQALAEEGSLLWEHQETWEAQNLPPTLEPEGPIAEQLLEGRVELALRAAGDELLLGLDPGPRDTVSMRLAQAPDWIRLSEEGVLEIDTLDEGQAELTLFVADDLGLESVYPFEVEVYDPDTGGGGWWDGGGDGDEDEDEDDRGSGSIIDLDCCLCGGSSFFFVGLWGHARRRRR
jgi:hypothetical protein